MISPEVLRRYPYFATISDESLKKISMIADEKSVPAETMMFKEGDAATALHIIVSGEINIQYELGSGELRTVDTLVAGDLLCWSALIEPYKATANGTAATDLKLVAVAADKLRALCDEDPRVGYQLTKQVAKLLAHRLEGARVQLAAAD